MMDTCNTPHCVTPTASRPANQITVLFDDVALTFTMPAAATLADVAQRVAREGGSPRRRVISVIVKLNGETVPLAA
jgi:hypothetical protein